MVAASSTWIRQSFYTDHMTTPYIVFSVSYYLGSQQDCNYLLYISFFVNKGQIGYMDTLEH